MNKFLKRFIFGEDDEAQPGKICIVMAQMKFEADFNNLKDFERALHLIQKEMEIMFDDVSSDSRSVRK